GGVVSRERTKSLSSSESGERCSSVNRTSSSGRMTALRIRSSVSLTSSTRTAELANRAGKTRRPFLSVNRGVAEDMVRPRHMGRPWRHNTLAGGMSPLFHPTPFSITYKWSQSTFRLMAEQRHHDFREDEDNDHDFEELRAQMVGLVGHNAIDAFN